MRVGGDLPAVLVPGFDLGVAEVEFSGQFHPVLDTQVLLPLEALFKSVQLVVGERRSRLSRLLRLRHVTLEVMQLTSNTGSR